MLYSTGTECSCGSISLGCTELHLGNLHTVAPVLCQQHDLLTKLGTAVEEGSSEAPAGAFKALTQMYEIADFMADELQSDEVRGNLEDLAASKNLPSWVEIRPKP